MATASRQPPQLVNVLIRNKHVHDAPKIAELADQVGYPVTVDAIRSRLETVFGRRRSSRPRRQKEEMWSWLASRLTIAVLGAFNFRLFMSVVSTGIKGSRKSSV
jgi:hypothetical protein